MNAAPHTQDQVRKLVNMLQGIRLAMLTTTCPDGSLRSRPMATLERPFDGDLWFFTDVRSAKIHEIEAHQQVNLAYADSVSDRYVSIAGTAQAVRDEEMARQLFRPQDRQWFPGGPEDPALTMLKVHVQHAEYWDAQAGKMGELYREHG